MKLADIELIVASHVPRRFQHGELIASAVLVPLRLNPHGEIEIILTRRADTLLAHAGQVAFPGGRLEASDATPIAAALREAHEELGIPSEYVQILGRLDDFLSMTGYHVTPVVGVVDPKVKLQADPHEVARIFTVPLKEFLQQEKWQQQIHTYDEKRGPVWHFPYDNEDTWGVTAHILRGFMELIWNAK